jgi:hypothetical protein
MKDPAVLIYFDKWISSTNGMKAEFRAWYFDLLIYQYDKGAIPNDMDEIAGICRVRPSEYDLFKQMVKQVLEQKFKLGEDNMYRNPIASDVLRKREEFIEKRSRSGNIGVVIKSALTIKGFKPHINKLKEKLFNMSDTEIENLKDKQVLEQMLKLFINVNVDEDINLFKYVLDNKKDTIPTIEEFLEYVQTQLKEDYPIKKFSAEMKYKSWIENGWKDGNNTKIKNWKSKILNTIPYLNNEQRTNNNPQTTVKIIV